MAETHSARPAGSAAGCLVPGPMDGHYRRSCRHRRLGLVAVALTSSTPVPAPHTDGKGCAAGWFDLDGNRSDGCEARSDYVAGSVLSQKQAVHANLVPTSATDVFATHVSG